MNLNTVSDQNTPPIPASLVHGVRRHAVNLLAFVSLALLLTLAVSCSNSPTGEQTSEPSQAHLATPTQVQEESTVQAKNTATNVAPSATPTVPSPTATATPSSTPKPLAIVEGQVLDIASGHPVADAVVSLGAAQTSTDADGRYRIDGLAPGQYVLVADHPGYDPFVSSIVGIADGETHNLDVLLPAEGAAAIPRDPMASNQVDPAGAPTATDAERLARAQGFAGPVSAINETVLEGEYLVNYKQEGSLRAALAQLNHPAWELIDQNGVSWYIVQICGNLAMTKPPQAQVPDSYVVQPNPVITVGDEPIPGYACPAETCEVVTTLPAGWYGATLGCSQECRWIWVQVPDIPGGCWIQASGLVVYGDTGQLPAFPGDMNWSIAERIGSGGGPTQQLLVDKGRRLWAVWEEHVSPQPDGTIYDSVHYSNWNGQAWNEPVNIPGSENTGESMATVLQDGSLLVDALFSEDLATNSFQVLWLRWADGQWSTVPEMTMALDGNANIPAMAADGFGNIHLLGHIVHTWDGASWRETGALTGNIVQPGAVALDQARRLHVVTVNQGTLDAVDHWTWDGSAWTSETIYAASSPNEVLHYDAGLAIGPDGTLHVVWVSTTPRPLQQSSTPPPPRPHRLVYSRRTAGGWAKPAVIFEADTDDGAFGPDVAVLTDGLVVAVIGDVNLGIEGLWNGAFVTWGLNDNWAEPVRISPDIKIDPIYPSLAVDADGRVHVLFSDRGPKGVFFAEGLRQ
ncbi:MAG: carboxypeptidase regulatory-like domain-containing protein [Anaerolineae bacterium]|nr:carboxypeptidase regulatory-like domain-containing protein [Anaerolineae bacterium]